MSKKNKKKNSTNKDLIAVLFIFAVMILAAVGMTMCGRNEIEMSEFNNGADNEKKEEDNSGEIVVMTAVGVAAVIVICFAVKKAKDTERRNKAIREHNERLEEQKRIEEARERVRQARLQEMIDAYDVNDKRLDSYYRNKYDDLYEGLYNDELPEDDGPQSLMEKIRDMFANLGTYWWIILGIVVIAIIGGVIIVMLAL